MSELKAIWNILRGKSVMFKIHTIGDYNIETNGDAYFTKCNWSGRVTVNDIPILEYTGVRVNK